MKNLIPFKGRAHLPSAPFSVSRDVRAPGELQQYSRQALQDQHHDQVMLPRIAYQALKTEWGTLLRTHPSLKGTPHPQANPGRIDIVHQHELNPDLDAKTYRKIARALLKSREAMPAVDSPPSLGALALNVMVTHEVNDEHILVMQAEQGCTDSGVQALNRQRAASLRLLGGFNALRPEYQHEADYDDNTHGNPADFGIGIPIARFSAIVSPATCYDLADRIQGHIDSVIIAGQSNDQPATRRMAIPGLSDLRVGGVELLG